MPRSKAKKVSIRSEATQVFRYLTEANGERILYPEQLDEALHMLDLRPSIEAIDGISGPLSLQQFMSFASEVSFEAEFGRRCDLAFKVLSGENRHGITPHSLEKSLFSVNVKLPDELVKDMFSYGDQDCDEVINYEEFQRLMRKTKFHLK